jgi:cell division protein FtsW
VAERGPVRSGTNQSRPKLRVVKSTPKPAPRRAAREADAAYKNRRSIILLMVPASALTVLGLVMVLSAGSISAVEGYGTSFWYFERQGVYALVGVIGLFVAARIRHTAWKGFALPLLIGTVPLLLLTFHSTAGSSLYGASRWINMGPITLQPSEFAKLALVVFTATVLSIKGERLSSPRQLAVPLAPVVLLVAGIVIMQRDLGTTTILCGSVFLMLFAAGVKRRHLAAIGAASIVATAALIFGESYRRTRFLDSFIHPWTDPKGAGYQLVQGLIALGSGGWFGVGLGASRQRWNYLPNAHSDFIFAIVGEELGLIGAMVVLGLFVMLLYAGVRIAARAPDPFGRLLAVGITSWIALQTIVNLGAVTGLLPITGVPLPLVSFGGTALVVTLTSIGILASIGRAGVAPSNGKATATSRSGQKTTKRQQTTRQQITRKP